MLSEGHNLQDCGHLLNYDLHWNPTRMVQRAGRIDRIGSPHDTLWIYNMFPEEGLERLLRLVQSLNVKISYIDQAGFHDASILGESAHPQDFNTLRRIRDEDDAVIEEEEDLLDLASSDSLAQQLRQFLESEGRDVVDDLPDGIHSGLVRSRAKGVFFYFQAGQPGAGGDLRHFWRYVDLQEERILDNRQLIATLIACSPDTPRVVDPALWSRIFDLQEEVIEDILQSVIERKALEVAPRSVEPVQQTVATVLQSALHHPAIDRQTAIEAIRYLAQPMVRAEIRALRQEVRAYQKQGDVAALLASVGDLRSAALGPDNSVVTELGERRGSAEALRREDLRLICFDLVTGG